MPTRYSGYTGEILDIDLSSGKIGRYDVDDHDREMFIGGKSLAAKILWDNLPPGIDPLSEQNMLVMTTGPLTGSGAPCSSRFNVSSKSVMTGGIASSNCGGDFGLWLKKAGFDGMIIRGRADHPVSIQVVDDQIKIVNASHLWGLDTEKTQELLPGRYGKLVIGPAGENLVRYACVMSGDRALGRTGIGAIFGSKNLKAITAVGSCRPSVADPIGFRKAVKDWIRILHNHPITGEQLARYGSASIYGAANAAHVLPTRNFQAGHWEFADDVSGETMASDFLVKNSGCSSCPIRCGRVVKAYNRKVVKGPEFETIGMFGPDIANREPQKIIDWNYEMDLLGLDTISTGSTLAFAMELTERGLLKSDLKFGKSANISKMLKDIAHRRGLGNDLAEGSMRLAKKYGGEDAAIHSKGLELASYEPRGAVGQGLGYAMSNRGGCHLNGGYLVFFEAVGPIAIDPLATGGKAGLTIFQQNTMEAVSSSGNCLFTTYAVIPPVPEDVMPPTGRLANIVSKVITSSGPVLNQIGKLPPWMLPFNIPLIPHSGAVAKLTGMSMDLGRFMAAGERGYTLERLFNMREGMTEADDSLPSRLTDVPQRAELPDSKVPLDILKPEYYKARYWDAQGVPSLNLLKKLNMEWAIPDTVAIAGSREKFALRRTKLFAKESKVLGTRLAQLSKAGKQLAAKRDALALAQHRTAMIERAELVRGSLFSINTVKCTGCGLCIKECPVGAISKNSENKSVIDPAKCISCGKCETVCPPNFAAVMMRADAATAKKRAAVVYRVDYDKCKLCGLCARKCPVGCIAYDKKKLAIIDEEICVRCGNCETVCPPKFDAVLKLSASKARTAGKKPAKAKTPALPAPASVPAWFGKNELKATAKTIKKPVKKMVGTSAKKKAPTAKKKAATVKKTSKAVKLKKS
jgi:aldehyde:ferredoxin oxidoreductase